MVVVSLFVSAIASNTKTVVYIFLTSLVAEDDGAKEEDKKAGTGKKNETIYTDANLADIVDYVLNSMDINKDGYVNYTEYRMSEESSLKGSINNI